jgi:two-component system chemotaxis response regulator CheB
VIPVRIAIVDDARFIREALVRLLAGDARIDVVGTAASGEELLARLDEWQPDAVTLDLQMPGLGGLETLRELMGDGHCRS